MEHEEVFLSSEELRIIKKLKISVKDDAGLWLTLLTSLGCSAAMASYIGENMNEFRNMPKEVAYSVYITCYNMMILTDKSPPGSKFKKMTGLMSIEDKIDFVVDKLIAWRKENPRKEENKNA